MIFLYTHSSALLSSILISYALLFIWAEVALFCYEYTNYRLHSIFPFTVGTQVFLLNCLKIEDETFRWE